MPSNLDFDSTKKFRDFILGKTLQKPNGPQTFNSTSYPEQNLNNFANIKQGNVDSNRTNDLLVASTKNTYKPEEYFINDTIDTLPRKSNLSLYPYFKSSDYGLTNNVLDSWRDYNLVSVINNSNYNNESELIKFASNYIKTDNKGPVFSRIAQNVAKSTLGKNRLLDALNGNTAAALNIITGREPLVEANNSITVDPNNASGIPTDFLTAVNGTSVPYSIIPGDYLSNPANPLNYNAQNPLQIGTLLNDATNVVSSMFGLQGKPSISPRPSDILIQYMGQGQKSRLFDLLSYSKYSPNYTLGNEIQNFLQNGIQLNSGIQLPGSVYIGDDKYDDVKYSISDFWDRQVRSSYYLSLMFDADATRYFHSDKNYSDGGKYEGGLTWISKNSRNTLGANNQSWQSNASTFNQTLSTNTKYRRDSILGLTQELLQSMPHDGGAARSHVANVIDQTSRVFREGDVSISRGSAVKYTDKFTGQESGVEYARVWTKDRPYLTYNDVQPLAENSKEAKQGKVYKSSARKYRRSNIRRFNSSVLDNTWNLNIAPMSDGKKSFDTSTNIQEKNKGQGDFYAKKYMFSIENLAWKTSNTNNFTVADLPACERGNNGGRVMWFPPYDLKVSEQNNASWDGNKFIGRPEPIYTYQYTERTGQVSFKVVVDHPSVINLLVREHFKGMSDEEADNYINAFFAGVQDLDFYSLVQTYTTLDPNDVKLIQQYLNAGTVKDVITTYKYTSTPVTVENKNQSDANNSLPPIDNTETIYFPNDIPSGTDTEATEDLLSIISNYSGQQSTFVSTFTNTVSNNGLSDASDIEILFGGLLTYVPESVQQLVDNINNGFNELSTGFTAFNDSLNELVNHLSGKTIGGDVTITIFTTTSEAGDESKNFFLGIRRLHAIFKYIIDKISNGKTPNSTWFKPTDQSVLDGVKSSTAFQLGTYQASFRDFGYEMDGNVIFNLTTWGENAKLSNVGDLVTVDCSKKFNTPSLKITAPQAFYCREGKVNINYTPILDGEKKKDPQNIQVPKIQISKDSVSITNQKPNIDVMKRIIMKTLSECFYFKKLEETSPVQFKSLTEKLKYFHPGFHSTTPEGLNSRLTFLLQCVRPGDTIPVKGINDVNDLNARNTSFGPPPICVLRIGDFYHSKIIIKDVNITYEDGVWDLNPEGIGVQPMIANVTLQVSFIGGQGLDKPVEKLQNALSSNFFANTEMYDERSIPTDGNIADQNKDKFTKSFLESLQKDFDKQKSPINANGAQGQVEGNYIGLGSGNSLDYTTLIDDFFNKVVNYTTSYKSSYENIYKTYGPEINGMFFSDAYRTINEIDVQGYATINLLGLYSGLNDIPTYSRRLIFEMEDAITNNDLMSIFGFDLGSSDLNNLYEETLKPIVTDLINKHITDLTTAVSVNDVEKTRNELISTIDKLNYIYSGYDAKITGTTINKIQLSSFVNSDFVNEYKNGLDFLNATHTVITDCYDSNFDYNNFGSGGLIDTEHLTSVLKYLLVNDKKDIVDPLVHLNYGDDLLSPITQNFYNIFDTFISNLPTTSVNLPKTPIRSNSNTISYVASNNNTTITQDNAKSDDIFKINATKYINIGSKLNFYKP
jgi:hypothetical protein